jgi:hypothetical protein
MCGKIFSCKAARMLVCLDDETTARRMLIFIRLLVWFAVDVERFLLTAYGITSTLNVSSYDDAKAVWDACVSCGVLRQNNGRFDAYDWLFSQELIEIEGGEQ